MRREITDRIRSDLERRGVAPDLSHSLSRHLAPIVADLGPDAYEAVLGGVTLAFGARGPADGALQRTSRDLEEVQQLLCDFGTELRKLDEALEVLAAYALRLRAQTASSGTGGGHLLN